jgi:hypothetical protein
MLSAWILINFVSTMKSAAHRLQENLSYRRPTPNDTSFARSLHLGKPTRRFKRKDEEKGARKLTV